jgi:hypothetical protein
MPDSLSPGQAEKLKHDWEFFGASISEAMCSPICPGGFRRTVGTRLVGLGRLFADELAVWQNPRQTWDMAMFGLRVGPGTALLWITAPSPWANRPRSRQHATLFADELAVWQNPEQTWDMAMFGSRVGPNPQAMTARGSLRAIGPNVEPRKGEAFAAPAGTKRPD